MNGVCRRRIESNFKMANDLLFAPLKILQNQIHRLRGEDAPETAAKLAEAADVHFGEFCGSFRGILATQAMDLILGNFQRGQTEGRSPS